MRQTSKSQAGACWLRDAKATTVFPKAAIAGNQWSSGAAATVRLPLGGPGGHFELPVHQAKLTVVLSGDHQLGKLGIIGGVLDREEFIEIVRDLAGGFSPDLCKGATFDAIAEQIRQMADIMKDGSQDPNKECDGISIGIGFTLDAASLGPLTATPPPPNPCP